MRIKKYKYVTISAESEDSIIYAEYADNLSVDLPIAKELVNSRLEFTGNKQSYVVIDLSNVKQVTSEAKEYLQRQEGGLKNILGAAFVAKNPVSALIANIFVKTNSGFESRFFSDRTSAAKWLKNYKEKKGNSFVN